MTGDPWIRFGWDGVSLEHPPVWDVVAVRPQGRATVAEFADGSGPAALLSWEPAGRGFSIKKASSRIERSVRRTFTSAGAGGGIRFEADTEEAVPEAEGGREVARFRWTREGGTARAGSPAGATGVIVLCRVCGRATVIHIFAREGGAGAAARVMASLRDHAEGARFVWRAFGLEFDAPAGFRHAGHSYDARGFSRLALARPGETLTVARWGLARSQIGASGGNLEGFFRRAFAPETRRFGLASEPAEVNGHEAVAFRPRPTGAARVALALLKRVLTLGRPLGLVGAVWHCEPSNRLYALSLASRGSGTLARAMELARGVRCRHNRQGTSDIL